MTTPFLRVIVVLSVLFVARITLCRGSGLALWGKSPISADGRCSPELNLGRAFCLPLRVIHDRGREVQEYGNSAQVREPGSDLLAVQQ